LSQFHATVSHHLIFIAPFEYYNEHGFNWITQLFLCAENVEAWLTNDLTEQLQDHVVVSLLNRALIVDFQRAAFMHVVLLLIDEAAAYSTQSPAQHPHLC